MKLWIDDKIPNPNPNVYIQCPTVNIVKKYIEYAEQSYIPIDLIDLDDDAGEYVEEGGNYVEILRWLEETKRNYRIHIHAYKKESINQMREIIQRNNWKEVI